MEGQPSIDLWEVDPRRYGAYATERYAVARCIDIYEDEYAIVYPQDDRRPGRPARTSPLYDRFRDAGAVFGVRNGWERPYWFAPAGTEPRDRPSFRRTNWFDAVGKEARAVRERAGVLELSSFSKYEVHGPGAEAFLDRLCANRLPRLGRIALSQLLTRARRDRVRRDRDAARARALPRPERRGRRAPRPRLAPSPRAGGRERGDRERDALAGAS